MRSRSALVLLTLAVVTLVWSCKPAEDTPADAAAAAPVDDAAAVRAALESWDPAYLIGNADTMAAIYTEDAARMNADTPIQLGRPAIRDFFESWFATWAPTTSSNPIADLVVVGDWAWARGTFTGSDTHRETGEVLEDAGKWVAIKRRTPDGWRTQVDIWNSDNPFTGQATPLASITLPPAEERIDAPAADVEAMRAVLADWKTAWETRNVDLHMARYGADAVRMSDRATTEVGLDAIRASYVASVTDTTFPLADATLDAIEVDGDWAWSRGHFGTTLTFQGQTWHDTGKYLLVSQRTPEGWKVKVEIWNRDQPLPVAPPPPA